MKKVLLIIFVFAIIQSTQGQDSTLLKMVNNSMDSSKQREYVLTTFKGSNVINLETVEQPGKNVLQFMMMHRFGRLNEGAYNFFGLDNAVLRLGLTYGLTSRIAITIGRSSLDKALDAAVKFKILRQSSDGKIPISMSGYISLVYPTIKYSDKPYLLPKYRPIYTTQLLIARKINEKLSLLLVPSYIHFNIVEKANDKNDIYALGTGGRYKLSKRMSIIGEYDFLPTGQIHKAATYNSFSSGLEMETGGHVFQLVFTNSQGMTAPYYLSKTDGRWGNGDIYFGFNISRDFNFKKR